MRLGNIVLALLCTWLAYLASIVYGQSFQLYSTNPDIQRNTTQLLTSRGFNYEIHWPITKDGYILNLVRIVNPFITDRTGLRPIYFQHGLFGNADDFLLGRSGRLLNGVYYDMPSMTATNCTGIETQNVAQSLALVLSTCGYDIWLGNYRGTRYSNKHVVMTQRDNEYWSYSVDELGLYDIPANIEYILANTGRGELGFVGHSLGTSGMFQLLSARPQYSQYIRPFISLAPVTHVATIKAVLLQVAANNAPLIATLGAINAPLFGITSTQLTVVDQLISTFVCGNSLLQPLCTFFVFTLCGFDYPNTDPETVTWTYAHFPDGQSSRALAHMGQRVVKNTFSFYDFGPIKNQELYQSTVAPVYNISRIDNRYMIFVSGLNDFLADVTDVDLLRSQLTVRPYIDYVVPFPLFNHVDFLFGNNVGQVQNSLILRWLQDIYQQS